ncbi:uncharacterized protein LOC143178255 isoform X1 [Calliopsis andreniformis]|uniref:uncharacterized protein LOC143178255 isoform X1 n=1 Tax=Calliopsis andreniformis TaxID=337506 RepID=UPI003FCD0864
MGQRGSYVPDGESKEWHKKGTEARWDTDSRKREEHGTGTGLWRYPDQSPRSVDMSSMFSASWRKGRQGQTRETRGAEGDRQKEGNAGLGIEMGQGREPKERDTRWAGRNWEGSGKEKKKKDV